MSDRILMAHGAGGKMSHELISRFIAQPLANDIIDAMDDSAVFDLSGRVAFTTDSYVVSPIFFPGGDIGKLAVTGTVNDLATSGAVPKYLSLGLIIEEGFSQDDLVRIVESIRATALEAGVRVVTGDTKVVNHGSADKIFINTAGIGIITGPVTLSGSYAREGDKVIISGTIGDHGIAVLSKRSGLSFDTDLESDCAPLGRMVAEVLRASANVHTLRDPTRGGLATTLNEIADQSKVGIRIVETRIPVRPEVQGACEMLGLDPLYVANEGKMVAVVPAQDAERVLDAMRADCYGSNAAIIGDVIKGPAGRVVMKTCLGASRIVDMLAGDPLPRIC